MFFADLKLSVIYGKILHYDFKNKDPFGGIHGESKSSAPSPFKIDKDEALKEINESLDIWDEKKVAKKTFLQILREGKKKR